MARLDPRISLSTSPVTYRLATGPGTRKPQRSQDDPAVVLDATARARQREAMRRVRDPGLAVRVPGGPAANRGSVRVRT